MTQEQLKIWFWKQFNSCYPVVHDDIPSNILMIYDEAWLRDVKLNMVLDKPIEYPKEHTGKIIFYLNFKNSYLNVNYDKIWSFLEQNYSTNYLEIRDLIKGWLNEADKLKVLTPKSGCLEGRRRLNEADKLKVLTPNFSKQFPGSPLNDGDKLRVLTPVVSHTPTYDLIIPEYQLNEADKLNILK